MHLAFVDQTERAAFARVNFAAGEAKMPRTPSSLLSLVVLLCSSGVCRADSPDAAPSIAVDEGDTCQVIDHFWSVFQGNDYEQVDDLISELTVAHDEHPDDATVAFLLGGSHLWKFQERGRACLSADSVLPHAELAVHYLGKVQELDPGRRTVDVFRHFAEADVALVQGDEPFLSQSLSAIRVDACQDPAFNGFVQGWVFSAVMSEDDCNYPEAIEGYFATFDACAGFRVPRSLPRLGPLLYSFLKLQARKDPVCFNTKLAPHNLEGTLLGLGDAFVKNGNFLKARMAYRSARRAPSYESWPYQDQIELRLANLRDLEVKFSSETGQLDVSEPAMFFQSSYACTACHAR